MILARVYVFHGETMRSPRILQTARHFGKFYKDIYEHFSTDKINFLHSYRRPSIEIIK